MKQLRKSLKRFTRKTLRKIDKRYLALGLTLVVIFLGALYSNTMSQNINPQAYTALLETVAKGESNGNYNAYFGSPTNNSLKLTDMTVAEVLSWQEEYVKAGSPSNAVGRYQIIQPTLEGLVTELKIQPSEKFDKNLQDKMAITLMDRRGAKDLIEEKLSKEEFAANLAKEWAALPKVIGENPSDSYYAGDGLNKSNIPVDTILNAVSEFEKAAK